MASSAKRFANSRIENYMRGELGAEDGSGQAIGWGSTRYERMVFVTH